MRKNVKLNFLGCIALQNVSWLCNELQPENRKFNSLQNVNYARNLIPVLQVEPVKLVL